MQHFDEAQRIWKEFVPQRGQAETVQGELLRAVEKLRDEAIRNGNINWDEGFEVLLKYLEQRLLNEGVFPATTLLKAREILTRLQQYDHPVLDDAPYDWLGDRVVEYFRHFGSQPHKHNPALHR